MMMIAFIKMKMSVFVLLYDQYAVNNAVLMMMIMIMKTKDDDYCNDGDGVNGVHNDDDDISCGATMT